MPHLVCNLPHSRYDCWRLLGIVGNVVSEEITPTLGTVPGWISGEIHVTSIHSGNVGKVTDGYHTFDSLYAHRRALTAVLVKAYPSLSWRSKRHFPTDGYIFDGYFIVGMDLPDIGQISYHYKLNDWDRFNGVKELPHAPQWDGHTPETTIERLELWADV